jgi:hypothetical protein
VAKAGNSVNAFRTSNDWPPYNEPYLMLPSSAAESDSSVETGLGLSDFLSYLHFTVSLAFYDATLPICQLYLGEAVKRQRMGLGHGLILVQKIPG